jgi:hypothetical protein
MIITNKLNLPDVFVRAVENDPYSPGDCDISCTALIDANQPRRLRLAHEGEITEDVSDRIWALIGQLIHGLLERGAPEHAIVEERFFMDIGRYKVSGQVDTLIDGVLTDYKVTSVWSVVYGKPEWERQLNVLAALARANGHRVDKVQIIAILRDWSKYKAREKGYPGRQVVVLEQPLWTQDTAVDYIQKRLGVHFSDAAPVQCTDEERWARPDTFAVMGKGRKRALRVLGSASEAAQWAEDNSKEDVTIEHRPGESVRCESYCNVRDWCPQYQQETQK